MNNLSINKYQASLSIEELLQQPSPQQQQNWLLTYLDVFVLIIMLVVTLMALSDFKSEEHIKRAQFQQKTPEQTHSLIKNIAKPIAPSTTKLEAKENKKTKHHSISNQLKTKASRPSNKTPEKNKQISDSESLNDKSNQTKPAISQDKVSKKQIKTKIEKTLTNIQNTDLKSIQNNKSQATILNTTDQEATLQKHFQHSIEELGLSESVNLNITHGYAQLEIQDKILFKSSESALLVAGKNLLTKLTPLLTQSAGLIYIEGHTDNRPIKTKQFPSNWELGASRATSVLHFLASQNLDETMLRAITYADTKPIADNNTTEGREKNRRVSIIIKIPDKENQEYSGF